MVIGILVLLSAEGVKKLVPTTGSGDNPLFQVTTNKPLAAFAVNVAWGEEYLPDLLAVLEEHEATATFLWWVIGWNNFPNWPKTLRPKDTN